MRLGHKRERIKPRLSLTLTPEPPLTPASPLRYLQEVGYTDTILDVKSQRVRALLGLTGDSGEKPSEKKAEPMVNGTEPSSLKDSGMVRYEMKSWLQAAASEEKLNHMFVQRQEGTSLIVHTHPLSLLFPSSKPDMSDSATVLEAFKFIESAAAEFSDEDEEEDSEGRDKTILDLATVRH